MKQYSNRSGNAEIDPRPNQNNNIVTPFPNSQTYCFVATVFSHDDRPNGPAAVALFNEAVHEHAIPADGRLVNAVLRCFGSDVDQALFHWKSGIGRAVRKRNDQRRGDDDLIAAYHGFFTVCRRGRRPDVALRLVYAMTSLKLEVDETALRCYDAGKKGRNEEEDGVCSAVGGGGGDVIKSLSNAFVEQYESVLVVECTKYDESENRINGERRVRIIF